MRETFILLFIAFIVLAQGCKGDQVIEFKRAQNEEALNFGQQMAFDTKAVLGKNLMKHMSKGEVIEALDFCSTRAIPLTDSMSQVLNVNVKRVSDKPRNINNKALDTELLAINTFKDSLSQKKQPTPILYEDDKHFLGYYPIITNAMCLNCHGNIGTDIKKETLSKINVLYPNDQATGYGLNEVRGIFVVKWDKEEKS